MSNATQWEDSEPFEFRSSDLALVASLRFWGMNSIRIEWDGEVQSCFWYFEETDQLKDYVDQFNQGEGRVEPSSFNKIFARIKNDMYDHMRSVGVIGNHRRS